MVVYPIRFFFYIPGSAGFYSINSNSMTPSKSSKWQNLVKTAPKNKRNDHFQQTTSPNKSCVATSNSPPKSLPLKKLPPWRLLYHSYVELPTPKPQHVTPCHAGRPADSPVLLPHRRPGRQVWLRKFTMEFM